MKQKILILFWKIFAKIFDLRPRLHLPEYTDYPIASCDIKDKYDYSHFTNNGFIILYEWDEMGKHWIVFTR